MTRSLPLQLGTSKEALTCWPWAFCSRSATLFSRSLYFILLIHIFNSFLLFSDSSDSQPNSNLTNLSGLISGTYIKKITNEGSYTQVYATAKADANHFCGLAFADGGLFAFNGVDNVTPLVHTNPSYTVLCVTTASGKARLTITGMNIWDECCVISNRDFDLAHS